MLDIKFIRENAELIKQNNQNRGVKVDIKKILDLDTKRRELIKDIEDLRAQRNTGSKGKPSAEEIAKMRKVGDEIKSSEEQLAKIEADLNDLLSQIPNLTHPSSPVGKEEDFKVLETVG